jgi:hypothetical protein
MRLRRAGRHDERGLALSSPLALLSAAAVVLAGIAFFSTNEKQRVVTTQVDATVDPVGLAPARTAPVQTLRAKHHHKKPVVRRSTTYVEVYNNSGISGLAGRTATRAAGAGWQVVGSDNWYGTIPSSTVYYPARLLPAARLLARDLGIHRLMPAIAPMRGDRLTVILTADYS